MANEVPNCWVILIDKKPRGPFSQEEVEDLIDSGEIGRNTLAFETTPDGKVALSGWKLLWQFSQFDRRQVKEGETAKPVEKERREEKPSEAISKEAEKRLPEEISDISPEQLVLHIQKSPTKRQIEGKPPPLPETPPSRRKAWLPSTSIMVSVGVAFLALGLLYNWAGRSLYETPTRVPLQEQIPTASKRTLPARKSTPLSGARPAKKVPAERDISEKFMERDIIRPPGDTGRVPEPEEDEEFVAEEGEADEETISPRSRKRRPRRSTASRKRAREEAEREQELEDEYEDDFFEDEIEERRREMEDQGEAFFDQLEEDGYIDEDFEEE